MEQENLIKTLDSMSKDTHNNKENKSIIYDIIFNSLYKFIWEFNYSIQFLIVLIFIGNTYNDTSMLNAFGIVQFLFYSVVINLSSNAILTFEIEGENAWLTNNVQVLGKLFYKTITISFFLSLFLSIGLFVLIKIISNLVLLDEITLQYINELVNIGIFYPIFSVQIIVLTKYLFIQNKILTIVIISSAQTILFLILNIIFITVSNLQLTGIALSLIISNIAALVLYCFFIFIYDPLTQFNTTFTSECFEKWIDFINKNFKYSIFFYFESLAFDILIILVFYVDSFQFTVYLILYSIYKIIWSFVEGISHSCLILTNDYLTHGDIESTYKMFNAIFLFNSLITKIFTIITFILVANGISYSIIVDALIAEKISQAEYSFCFALIFHSMAKLFIYYFLASGFKKSIIGIYLTHAYFVNLPICICFTNFFSLGSVGIFSGISVSYLILCAICIIIFFNYWDLGNVKKTYLDKRLKSNNSLIKRS